MKTQTTVKNLFESLKDCTPDYFKKNRVTFSITLSSINFYRVYDVLIMEDSQGNCFSQLYLLDLITNKSVLFTYSDVIADVNVEICTINLEEL